MTSSETPDPNKAKRSANSRSSQTSTRQERLEAELRSNLQRRKQQTRSRKAKQGDEEGGGPAS